MASRRMAGQSTLPSLAEELLFSSIDECNKRILRLRSLLDAGTLTPLDIDSLVKFIKTSQASGAAVVAAVRALLLNCYKQELVQPSIVHAVDEILSSNPGGLEMKDINALKEKVRMFGEGLIENINNCPAEIQEFINLLQKAGTTDEKILSMRVKSSNDDVRVIEEMIIKCSLFPPENYVSLGNYNDSPQSSSSPNSSIKHYSKTVVKTRRSRPPYCKDDRHRNLSGSSSISDRSVSSTSSSSNAPTEDSDLFGNPDALPFHINFASSSSSDFIRASDNIDERSNWSIYRMSNSL